MKIMKRFVTLAEKNGYRRGDMCTGGAIFISSVALHAIFKHDLSDILYLKYSILGEDNLSISSFICKRIYYLYMPEENDVLAINWRGLPMPLEELVSRNKKIVHPVKDKDPAFEAGVRDFFQKRRLLKKDLQQN